MAKTNKTTNDFFSTLGTTFASAGSVAVSTISMVDDAMNFIKEEVSPTVGKAVKEAVRTISNATDTMAVINSEWETLNAKMLAKARAKAEVNKAIYSSDEYKAIVEKEVLKELEKELVKEFGAKEAKALIATLSK